MTDLPSGYAELKADDSKKTSFIVTCEHKTKKSYLSYNLYFRDGFAIEDFMHATSSFLLRAGDQKAKEFDFSVGTTAELKLAFMGSDFRPYIGKNKNMLVRFPSLIGGQQTVRFDLAGLEETESKMKAHCGVK